MRYWYWWVGLVISVIGVASVGCGASSNSSSGATNTPPKSTAIATSTLGTNLVVRATDIPPKPTATATSTLGINLVVRATVTQYPINPTPNIEPSSSAGNRASGTPIPTPVDLTLQKVIAQAREDLAKRLSVDANQIELVQAQTVVWSNGSMECPKPGILYPQVELDGFLVRFRVSDRFYEYHSARSGIPFLCEPNK